MVVAPGQLPFTKVQRYTLLPIPMPLTVVLGLLALAKVPDPLTKVHVPLAGATAALAAKVTLATGAQSSCVGPALATAALRSNTLMVTWSLVVGGAQGPLFTVHWNTFVPIPSPVTALVALAVVVMEPEPLTNVHKPVAGAVAAVAASVVFAVFCPEIVQRS